MMASRSSILAVLASGALAQTTSMNMPNLTGLAPPLSECEPLAFTLSGGTPPYNLTIMQDGSDTVLDNWLNLQAGCYNWNLALPSGDSIMFMLTDWTGMMITALSYTTVQPGSSSCLSSGSSSSNTSMSSMSSGMSMRPRATMFAKRQMSGPAAVACNNTMSMPHTKKNNAGAIAGGTVGGLAGVALLGGALFIFLRRRRGQHARTPSESWKDSEKEPHSANTYGPPIYPFRDDSPRFAATPGPTSSTGHSATSTPSQALFISNQEPKAGGEQGYYVPAKDPTLGQYRGAAELQGAETLHEPDRYPIYDPARASSGVDPSRASSGADPSATSPAADLSRASSGIASSPGDPTRTSSSDLTQRVSSIMHGPRPLSAKSAKSHDSAPPSAIAPFPPSYP